MRRCVHVSVINDMSAARIADALDIVPEPQPPSAAPKHTFRKMDDDDEMSSEWFEGSITITTTTYASCHADEYSAAAS